MKVLDLDMDYFMESVAAFIPSNCTDRLEEEYYGKSVWSEERVRSFLENNLGLSKNKKIEGRIVEGHNEALFFWEELIATGRLLDPFEVIHVDSHADLGLGFTSYEFLQGAMLTLPIDSRRKVRDYPSSDGQNKLIDIGDYLLWGIAYRMISRLTYCANPNGEKNDYCWQTLKDFHEEMIFDQPVTNYIQLKYNKDMEFPYFNSDNFYKKQYLEGAIKDPEVEFTIIPTIEDVKYQGDFDYVVMAQSPNYTPKRADYIMDVFREYIVEI